MDWTVAIPIAAVAVPVLGAIVVERIRARAATKAQIAEAVAEALKGFVSRVADIEARATKFETQEPAELAKLRGDVGAIAADLATVRKAFEDRAREDDARRDRAGQFAREREKDLAEVMGELRIQLARFEERLAAQTARVEEQHRARR